LLRGAFDGAREGTSGRGVVTDGEQEIGVRDEQRGVRVVLTVRDAPCECLADGGPPGLGPSVPRVRAGEQCQAVAEVQRLRRAAPRVDGVLDGTQPVLVALLEPDPRRQEAVERQEVGELAVAPEHLVAARHQRGGGVDVAALDRADCTEQHHVRERWWVLQPDGMVDRLVQPRDGLVGLTLPEPGEREPREAHGPRVLREPAHVLG
jgi:hypothetical protein